MSQQAAHSVKVAVGLIRNASNELLITRRALTIAHGGLWEMPGGKFEPNETPYEALEREIFEEVGLKVKEAKFLGTILHTYPEKTVCLYVFEVRQYTGHASIQDGQLELKWIQAHEYQQYEFPEANDKVIELMFASSDSVSAR